MKLLKASALMAILLVCAILMLGVLSLRGLSARGGGGAALPGASMNGDVNCDGKVDIADAIYTLQHLFSDGPAPCALAQDDLSAIAARVAALEANKPILTGMYIGDGQKHLQPPQIISTGGKGKIRGLEIFSDFSFAAPTMQLRLDTMAPEGVSFEGVIFSGPDFIIDDLPTLNVLNRKYFWIAYVD